MNPDSVTVIIRGIGQSNVELKRYAGKNWHGEPPL